MAKLSAHGSEICRWISPKHRCQFAVMEDGVKLMRSPLSPTWKIYSRMKKGSDKESYLKSVTDFYHGLPDWRKVKTIPSYDRLHDMLRQGYCETPFGDRVEADGFNSDGIPSWLLIFNMI